MTETYELFAIKYAHHDRDASENFIDDPDPHEGNMPLEYYVWVAKNNNRTVLIDTGFNAKAAADRGRELIRCPAESLGLVGADANEIKDIVITHLHYDHVGNFDLFPKAKFHLQDKEMHYATGRYMNHKTLRHAYDIEHVVGMIREVYKERVVFHDGDSDLFPGIKLHYIGGHTMGMQSVTVETERGRVVVASDASHLYHNMWDRNPYRTVFNVGEMMEGHEKLRRLAGGNEDLIIPGHDPQVLEFYPAPSADLEGIVVRLDVPPQK